MEKRRRARINECLSQLKLLVLHAMKREVSYSPCLHYTSSHNFSQLIYLHIKSYSVVWVLRRQALLAQCMPELVICFKAQWMDGFKGRWAASYRLVTDTAVGVVYGYAAETSSDE